MTAFFKEIEPFRVFERNERKRREKALYQRWREEREDEENAIIFG